ncbi:hypothetical protein [Bacillus toyonensis]|uniref:hypothetical protein n=1 Tax=Bacillus toyonensis TaxID=155322 RepID=UPI002E250FD8|nr:hypothetical protein [Bacillus toyonensis]
MSGLYGGKGYFYQAIATVIHSIGEMDWTEVVMEPDNNRDKIDVVWHYSNGECKIAQIKSSKNSFAKPMILKVLSDLYNDSKGIQGIREYNLTLIGVFEQRASDFVNKIIERTVTEEDFGKYTELFHIKDKISISKENDSYDFEERIKLRLIEQSYEQYKYEDRVVTAHSNSLIPKFLWACAKKKTITIKEFREWIEPLQKSEDIVSNELELKNYLKKLDTDSQVSYVFEQLGHYLACEGSDLKMLYKERIQSIKDLIEDGIIITDSEATSFKQDLLFTDGEFTLIEPARVMETLMEQRNENPSTIQLAIIGGPNYLNEILEIPLKIEDDSFESQYPFSEDTLKEQSIITFYEELKITLNVKNYPYLDDRKQYNMAVLQVW